MSRHISEKQELKDALGVCWHRRWFPIDSPSGVMIDDALLPAASYLTGPDAIDVLRTAVEAVGNELLQCQISQVQYRPQSDLIVRYRCDVRHGDKTTSETLLAGTTTSGPHIGTLPVEAETPDGRLLQVGVWRWPFDPVLTDLAELVTPSSAARLLSAFVGEAPTLEVVVYRPTERAVVRATGPLGQIYVKVLPPSKRESVELRHHVLADGGLPVARILTSGPGWLAMTALAGTTLRDRLKDSSTKLLSPERITELLRSLADIQIDGASPARSRLIDAPHHAAMITTVLPELKDRLDDLIGRLGSPLPRVPTSSIHGDLHESQLVVDDSAVIGLLDIDDVGPGDALDDVGTLLAHLEYRHLTKGDARLRRFVDATTEVLSRGHEPDDVGRHGAASLIGLATVPFTLQIPTWQATTVGVLDIAQRYLTSSGGTPGA
jgi:aminoglycoside phosphotransferase